MPKLTIDDVARMSQEQLSHIDEQLGELKATVFQNHTELKQGQARLEQGLQSVLDAVLELPSKKVVEKLTHKVEDIDERLGIVERKLAIQ